LIPARSLLRAAGLGLLAALLLARTAPAEEGPSRVVLLSRDDEKQVLAQVLNRLAAELGAVGFGIDSQTVAAEADPRDQVEAAAQQSNAFSAIAVIQTKEGAAVDIWISDQVTGKTVVRRLELKRAAEAEQDLSVLAVRAVELLRASLVELEIQLPGQGQAQEEPPDDVASWVAESTAGRLQARARVHTPGVAASAVVRFTPEIGPSFGPQVFLFYEHVIGLGLQAGLVGPCYGAEVSSELGRAELREEMIAAHRTGARSLLNGKLSFHVRLGAGALHARAVGRADPPLIAQSDDTWLFALDGGLGGRYWLSNYFALALDVHVSACPSDAPVRIADQPAARLCRPAINSGLGLAVRL
jgi:hypothetical protein